MYKRFKELCEKKGVSVSKACKDIGISPGNVNNWKQRESIPSSEICNRIAEYFNVSIDYFVTGKIPSIKNFQPSPEQQNAIYWYKLYSMASPEVQKAIDLLLKPSE